MRLPVLFCLFVAACGTTYEVPSGGGGAPVGSAPAFRPGASRTAADFYRVAARVVPAGEGLCREENPGAPADLVRVPDRARHRSGDAAERVPDHGRGRAAGGGDGRDPARRDAVRRRDRLRAGARDGPPDRRAYPEAGAAAGAGRADHGRAGGGGGQSRWRAGLGPGDPAGDGHRRHVGARSYSQSYELEADTLGAYVAARAGYDPARGVAIFERPALADAGGPPILTSHPGSVEREATVARVTAEIRRQQALGLVPTPGRAS